MKLFLVSINKKQLKLDSLREAFIRENALHIYGDLVKKALGVNSKDKFDKFEKISGIHGVLRNGEAARSDIKEAEKLLKNSVTS